MKIDEECTCGHISGVHIDSGRGHCTGNVWSCQCLEFCPVCTVDEQQCDAECQARPDRACATEAKSEESVYERAFKALYEARSRGRLEMTIPVDEHRDHDCLIAAGLTAGEAAEKRAEEAEKREEKWRRMVREAELRSIPNRIQQQDLLQEASGKYRKRAEAAERERDELKRWRDETVDIAICRQQFPDGSVPGNTVECAEGWFKIAHDELRRVRELERERDEARKTLAEIQAAQMKPPTASEYWGMDYCSKRADRAERERDEARKQVAAITRHCVLNESALELPENALRKRITILEEELNEASEQLARCTPLDTPKEG
jgi:hypothetical protein